MPQTHADTITSFLSDQLNDRSWNEQDLCRRSKLRPAVVHSIIKGVMPRHVAYINRIADALGLDRQDLAERFASQATGVSIDQGTHDLRWVLRKYLILNGLTINQVADDLQLELSDVRELVNHGTIKQQLNLDRLRDGLGIPQGEWDTAQGQSDADAEHMVSSLLSGDDDDGDESRTIDAEEQRFLSPNGQQRQREARRQLAALISSSMSRKKMTRYQLAAELNCGENVIDRLRRGFVPRNPAPKIPALAKVLDIDLVLLARLCAQISTGRFDRPGREGAPFLMRLAMYRLGLSNECLAERSEVSVHIIRHALQGRGPRKDTDISAICRVLQIPLQRWHDATRYHKARARIATDRLEATGIRKSLRTLIHEAVDTAGISLPAWAARHNINMIRIRKILRDGVAPRRSELRQQLCQALGLKEDELKAASRNLELEGEQSTRVSSRIEDIRPSNGIQEMLLRLIEQLGLSLSELADRCGVARATISKIVRYGAIELRDDVSENIRRFLGIDHDTFQRLAAPPQEEIEDAGEMRLLHLYRRLDGPRQDSLLDQAARLLSHQQHTTTSG